MGMNFGNVSKTSFQAEIKRKQQLFNRFKRRFKVSTNPAECRFLKTEATRVINELKQCNKKWKNWGFGASTWITKNFTVTNFNAARTKGGVKTSARSSAARKSNYGRTSCRKSSARKTTHRGFAKRTRASGSKTKSHASRRTYVAW